MKRWGRILRGSKPEDFTTLSDNLNRKIVFFIPDLELKKLEKASDYEKLKLIGWTDEEIIRYIAMGKQFKLITFFANADIGVPATRKNIINLVSQVYPNQKITKAFLTNTLNLNARFTGNGYTKTDGGKRGIKEIVGLNRNISDIPNYSIVDLVIGDFHLEGGRLKC